ncbi:ABC transporter permease [Corynebacterium pyruviciproducens]|uniref:ABC transporter permease n=1 Tax=Corynebacterium pyruviciproducens TaxID=598660 RepID=UPI00254AAE15|nr:ABC transporter permease [Corynebacterium pyruviciproducens]MDK7215191.1 ABC transporter permease [Corynebacterium pyruviciproducens]
MTAFKAFLVVLLRNIGFLVLFTGIMVVMGLTAFHAPPGGGDFAAQKPAVAVVNEGPDTALTRAFESYLEERTVAPDIDATSAKAVDDALYYESLAYAVYLPEGFTAEILAGREPTVGIKTRGTADSATAEVLVSRFLRLATGYATTIHDENALVAAIASSDDITTPVTVTSHLDQKLLRRVSQLYNFGSYTLLAGAGYVITMVLAAFTAGPVRRRTVVSSARPLLIDASLAAGCAIVVALLVALNIGLVHTLIPQVAGTGRAGLFALNACAYGLPVLALCFLLARLTRNKQAFSAIINVVALSSAFLCGAFIPQEMLPWFVRAVGHVLPTYYYVANNDALATAASIGGGEAATFWANIGIQAAFAVGLWVVAALVGIIRRRGKA